MRGEIGINDPLRRSMEYITYCVGMWPKNHPALLQVKMEADRKKKSKNP